MQKKTTPDNWRFKLFAYMSSQGVSLLGSTIVSFAVMWYITLKTGSGIAIAGVTITTYLPQALVLLFGGVLADRYSPKKIVMLSDSAIALSTLVLAVLFLLGIDNIGWIFFFNCLRSFGCGIQMPAIKSMLPLIVPEKELMRANSISTSIWCVIQLISPGISGIVMSFMSMSSVFFIDVITAVIGVSLLSTISMPARKSSAEKYKPIEELKSGIRYILSNRSLKNSILFYSIFSFLVIPASQLTPLLALQTFGNKIWILSTIETSFSIGALLVSLFLSYKALSTAPFKLIGFSATLFGLVMILLIPSKNIILFVMLMFIMGIGSPLYYTPLTTHIQEITDEAYLGRTFSFVELFSSVATPFGMLIFGPLSKLSIVIPFLIPGILLILLGLKSKKIS
ncbi:MFS transporter [Marinisporobacter balticus]|uniref:DHA3 family macrolide efflux protein-like MFS transporter n=1 Tax=Marinisporobacter balticus TaxID=2018667 RepID=A0A4R2K9U1_9FIRM|nr:MFS transporter [Marinisporobacter balticus]TCO68912.1 DHA3 family macrolide efflux protein-like MFS transporter [Marinisporobacter balticus]